MDPVKERVIQHIKLAQILASKYFNIPGASREEVLSEAHTALVKASMAYQEDKGPFIPFAGTVIRNALNSLFKKQLRQVQMIGKSLDETIHGATQFGTHVGNLGQNIRDTKKDIIQDINIKERKRIILKAIKHLTEEEKKIVYYISHNKTFEEIGRKYGVTRQAIFKKWIKAVRKLKSILESNQCKL